MKSKLMLLVPAFASVLGCARADETSRPLPAPAADSAPAKLATETAVSEPFPAVDAIVVLGGGVREGSPDEGGAGSLTAIAEKRLLYGLRLYRALRVPIYVSGGAPWRSGASEADIAARELVRLGVPQAGISREGQSTTTWENARRLAPLLKSAGVRRTALVTSAIHMPRAHLAFARAGIETIPAPTDYITATHGSLFLDLTPTFATLRDSFAALQEYLGIVMYTVRR